MTGDSASPVTPSTVPTRPPTTGSSRSEASPGLRDGVVGVGVPLAVGAGADGPGPPEGVLPGCGGIGSPAATTGCGLGAEVGDEGAGGGVEDEEPASRGERKGSTEPSGPAATWTASTAAGAAPASSATAAVEAVSSAAATPRSR